MVENQRIVLVVALLVVVLAAGCIDPPNAPNMDNNDDSDDNNGQQTTGSNGVAVSGPTCTVDGEPCSSAEITEFSIPKMTVSIRNTGDTTARVDVNGGSWGGRQVLTSMCPQYRIKEFRAEVSQGSSVRDVANQGSVPLQSGETLEMTWFVEVGRIDTTNVSMSCVFRFQTAFAQQLTTVKQVQVRGSEDIERTPGLTYETTAEKPVELVIDADDSVVQQVIGGEVTSLQAKAYLRNRGSGKITSAQYRTGERIHLTIPGLSKECSDRRVRITEGEQTITEQGVLCRFDPERIESSQVYELRAETTYNYLLELPPVEISLTALEAGR